MWVLLIVSLAAIIAISIRMYKQIGVFTFFVGITIWTSSSITGFTDLILKKQIYSSFFLISFFCLIIGILKYVRRKALSFSRKLLLISFITGLGLTIFNEYFSFFYRLIPSMIDFEILTGMAYLLVIGCLVRELVLLITKQQAIRETEM